MKVAIYARISRSDDVNYHHSIENQIKGISDYCKEHNYPITKIYKDINVSGKTMNRPAFIEMMKDVDNGIVDTIIVKDLSRFGRNHLEVGAYLDEIFIINDIRFIAIDDNYDNKSTIDEFVTFKNIFNEMYLKDLRKKIKFTFDYKAKTKLLNPRPGAFYGLTVDKDGNYIIDEEAAKVVRRIYALYIEGYSTDKIAEILSGEKIMNPGYYRYIKYNDKCALRKSQKDIYKWRDCTIYKILTNEGYTGRIINRKYLYENGKRILNPNPIIIENGLPQIIAEETFNKVKDIRNGKPKIPDRIYENPFPNIIKCGCCNKTMNYTFSVTMNMFIYECRKCKTRIYLDDFKLIVSNDIQEQIKMINDNEISNYNESTVKKTKREIKLIDIKIQTIFEQFTKDEVDENTLKDIINELTIRKNQLTLELEKGNTNINKVLNKLLNQEVDEALINKLVLSVSVLNTGRRKYDVHINYNFKKHNAT